MFGLDNFSFEQLWSPLELLVYVVIAAIYLLLTGPYRTLFKDSQPVSWQKKSMFLLGLAIIYFAQSGPLLVLAHLMFSAHMVAMTVSYILAPPLLILGIPAWIWRPALNLRFFKALRFFSHPVLSLILFNGLFSFYHIPAILDFVMVNFTLYRLLNVLLFVTSLLMWWPMVCPEPFRKLSELQKMGYIFIAGVLLTPACAIIIFSPTSLYMTFTDPVLWATALTYCIPGDPAVLLEMFEGPWYFTELTPVNHQQIGGATMKLIQEFLYISILTWVFFQWFKREKRKESQKSDEAAIMEWQKRMNQV